MAENFNIILYLLKQIKKWTCLRLKTKSVHFLYEINISNVIGKLGVTSRTQAIITLMKNGIINV